MFIKLNIRVTNNDKLYYLHVKSQIFLPKRRVEWVSDAKKTVIGSSSYLNKI